ncbi:MAG TPA: HIT family protein, partial [Gemmataceae bacterium]|nr:HIT family protein [Gemmataceae bacterium]
FPVSQGHTLIIPNRHVCDFLELTLDEMSAVFELLQVARNTLDGRYRPPGYNVGVNIGKLAGQTVMHAHVHLIPRFCGDVPDPVGGIRNLIAGKGHY